jgi:polar amino acid transport system substrate-binding protein
MIEHRQRDTTPLRRRLGWLPALAAVLVLVSPQRGHATNDAARALLPGDIQQRGTLIAAMPLDFEPFNFLDEGNQQVGLDVEIFQAVAGMLGLKPDIQRMSFSAIITSVKGGRVDVGMSALGILPARLPVISFVRYGYLSSGLAVRRGNPANIKTSDGCGHSLALEKGTNSLLLWQEIAKKCEAEGKPVNLMVFDGKGPQVLAVETGRAEAAGFSYASTLVAAKHSDGKLEAAPGGPIPGGTVEAGIAFGKDKLELGRAIEAALKLLVADGTYDKIFEKWGLSTDRAPVAIVQ